MIRSKRMRWTGYVARMGEEGEECIQGLGEKFRRKETTRKA
jgi:hypothetical protein